MPATSSQAAVIAKLRNKIIDAAATNRPAMTPAQMRAAQTA